MSKEQTDLATCPLCNSAMAIEQFVGWDGEDLPVKHVTHPKSECPLSGLQFEARAEAIEAWNRRASPSPAGGVQGVRIAELEAALRPLVYIAEWHEGTLAHDSDTIIEFKNADGSSYSLTVGHARDARAALTSALSSQAQTTGGVE